MWFGYVFWEKMATFAISYYNLLKQKDMSMRKMMTMLVALLTLAAGAKSKKPVVETWPDGTPMDAWFQQATKVDVNSLGKQYVLTDYGVLANSAEVQTQQIQAVIDRCAQE